MNRRLVALANAKVWGARQSLTAAGRMLRDAAHDDPIKGAIAQADAALETILEATDWATHPEHTTETRNTP